MRQARIQMAELLDSVEAGEEILITRRGKPVARLTEAGSTGAPAISFPSRRDLRERLPRARTTSAEIVRADRVARG